MGNNSERYFKSDIKTTILHILVTHCGDIFIQPGSDQWTWTCEYQIATDSILLSSASVDQTIAARASIKYNPTATAQL